MTDMPTIIAIDGPAASGKSTLGYALAERLNYLFFDTGIMYRAVTRAALDKHIDVHDEAAVTALAEALEIDIAPADPTETDGRQATVLIEGADQTWTIRAPEVDQNVSIVSAYPGVRQALSAKQRAIGERYGRGDAEKPGIVMVGRDIGTVVVPDAPLKVYMEASPEERARRRLLQQAERDETGNYARILADILRRDQQDSGRAHSPLRAADDAVILDTSNLSPEAVLAHLMTLVNGQTASSKSLP